jgi:hypothetical protein
VLAREAGLAFTWDLDRTLSRINGAGACEVSPSLPAVPMAVACSEDGKVLAAGGARGQLWLIGSDLMVREESAIPNRVAAIALDPFGKHVAVADGNGGLHFFSLPDFTLLWTASTPRPIHHLALVPEAPLLVGAADHGLVCAFDQKGQCLWRDGLVAHVASLSVSGNGKTATLACFSEGLICYTASKGRQERSPWPGPARLGALAYTGELVLAADLEGRISLRDKQDRPLAEWNPPLPPVAVALDPLGNQAFVALTDGQVVCLATGR